MNELDNLRERGIEVEIASLQIDTTTPHGKLIYTIISGLAEFEHGILSERTKQGLAATKGRGQRLGPPPKLTDTQIRVAKRRYESKQSSLRKLARQYGVHPSTIGRSIKRLDNNT